MVTTSVQTVTRQVPGHQRRPGEHHHRSAVREPTAEDLALLREGVRDVQRVTQADVVMGGATSGTSTVLSCFAGTRTTALHDLQIRAGSGLGGRAMATQKPVAVADYLAEGSITHDYDPYVVVEGIRSIIAVPVRVGSDVVALLYAGVRRPTGLGDRTASAISAVAAQLGQELRIRGEVARKVTAALRIQADAAPRVGGSELEEIRTVHAELRALAAGVGDHVLRQRLDAVSARLADFAAGRPPEPPPASLTPREVDVLAQVALGRTNAETAACLCVGAETVKAHLRSASRKLGARTRLEAVAAARRAGLLP